MVEKELKELIVSKFGNLKKFAEYIDMSWTTLDGVIKRGVNKTNITTLIRVCEGLGIDCESLYYGKIVYKSKENIADSFSDIEISLIEKFRELSPYEQETVEIIVNRFLDNQTTIKIEETPLRYVTLPAYGYAPSAGTGNYMPDDIPASTIQVPESPLAEKADFVVKVGGHSMEPKFMDGDLVLVKKAEVLDPGKIGIFSVNGEALIKEYFPDRLHSLNARYKDIDLNDGDTVRCLGEVIGKL